MVNALMSRSFVSTSTMLILLIFMIVGSIVATIYIRPTEFHRSRLNVFISIMASITVVLIGLSLIVSSITLEEQQEVNRATITKQAADKLWLFPNQMLVNSTHARDSFIKSLYPNNLALYRAASRADDASMQAILEEQNISIILIQAWEDFLTLRRLDVTGEVVWINCFIQWAQSPYLKKNFDFLKYNYRATTIEFGNILFEYAARLPIPTTDPELYRALVQEILRDPRLAEIFEKASF